jgi:hypothetical protein
VGCVDASEVSFSFAGTGGNTFTATQTIDTGNLDLDNSTATAGNLTKNGAPFLHNYGLNNTFLGMNTGNLSVLGDGNTAIGQQALPLNTTGSGNTAAGRFTLVNNTTGGFNTAIGTGALRDNTTGSNNVAIGGAAGQQATGSNNIYLGMFVVGIAGESDTMRLGHLAQIQKTFIGGVRGKTTINPDAIPVMIDSGGQLGTISSSIRFKEDVHDMADASRRLLRLRPVTFRYTQAYINGAKPIQYGLIAEEVAEAFPELAVRGAGGQVETVHYETLNVLLLNELQKQVRLNEKQEDVNDAQQRRIDDQQLRIDALERRLNALLDER